jgi:limonene 1,2-monooxygenase
MYEPDRMEFGIFLAPYHAHNENPTVALQRDVELLQHLDNLCFDEAWIGEHHSLGREIVPDPVSLMAYAAARTSTIRLGTGVFSLAYHHPLVVADRMVQMDHLTRGRSMLGVGPGALPSDANMMGIDPIDLRRRMNESLDAIMQLLMSEEPVNVETDWFTLKNAMVQVPSFSRPHLPVAVAALLSPSGPTAAGRHGIGVISVGGFDSEGFARTWTWAEEAAGEAGKVVDRATWRVVAPVHIADTRQQAIDDVRSGFLRRAYFGDWGNLRLTATGAGGKNAIGAALGLGGTAIEESIEAGQVIIGDPDDAVHALRDIQQRSGGFGKFLILAHEWAPVAETNKSYELWARYVAPEFQGMPKSRGVRTANTIAHMSEHTSLDQSVRAAFAAAGKEIPTKVDEALGR